MSRLGGWLRSSKKTEQASAGGGSSGGGSGGGGGGSGNGLSDEEFVAKQTKDIQDALDWAALIMNDDVDSAWAGLQKGDSSFHELGAAVTFFIRSVLGFEKQVMAEATQKLNDCEARVAADMKQTANRPARSGSRFYPPGTEYELVLAEAQLMGAVVGVLHESLIEAMKSFYRLRKAFLMLDSIVAVETRALESQASSRFASARTSGKPSQAPSVASKSDGESDDDDDGEFVDAQEEVSASQTPDVSQAPTAAATTPDGQLSEVMSAASINDSAGSLRLTSGFVDSDQELDLGDNPVDVFIHTAANMCFGMLLLILTLVPPAFSRILGVVGFRGDRARGVRMLWRSASFGNINGAVSGMVLLAYYYGLLGLVDILPDARDYDEAAEAFGPPRDKCRRLLAEMRTRYPDSMLWRGEESRQHASARDLPRAIEVLVAGGESKMKQVAALTTFELAIDAMFVQDWHLMRDTFHRCIDINDWSPAMYEYNAGCASLELYRDAVRAGRADDAGKHKKAAEASLRKAPTLAGKKRLMARQLPIETLLQRKLAKWEERARRLRVDLADAVGTSPALEMCYLWNGPKRMAAPELERGLANLDWGRCTAPADKVATMRDEKDEMAVWALSRAVLLRNLGRLADARELLEEHVLCHPRATFKGSTKDDYVLPAATYELGVMAWVECCNPPADLDPDAALLYRRAKLDECAGHLDTCKDWEAYTMDTRIGLRVQSGIETLGWFRKKMGW